jgi:GNAT superfamily N-acetyltransferase
MNTKPASPAETPVVVRPIRQDELDRVVLRCWPGRDALDALFVEQGTIGMAAWDGERCVGQLHCYRVTLPDGDNPHWPAWNRPWWWAQRRELGLSGPAWCHACLHVGRTLESKHQETLGLVYRFAGQHEWNTARTLEALNALDGVDLGSDELEVLIEELCASGQTTFEDVETQYQGRGIGTALCRMSVRWAREHRYAAVLAMGAPEDLFAYARWSGHLPWMAYVRLGFEVAALEEPDAELPGWARGNPPPDVTEAVRAALSAGRSTSEIRERLMVFQL